MKVRKSVEMIRWRISANFALKSFEYYAFNDFIIQIEVSYVIQYVKHYPSGYFAFLITLPLKNKILNTMYKQ